MEEASSDHSGHISDMNGDEVLHQSRTDPNQQAIDPDNHHHHGPPHHQHQQLPPWLDSVLQRLEYLESRAGELQRAEEVARAATQAAEEAISQAAAATKNSASLAKEMAELHKWQGEMAAATTEVVFAAVQEEVTSLRASHTGGGGDRGGSGSRDGVGCVGPRAPSAGTVLRQAGNIEDLYDEIQQLKPAQKRLVSELAVKSTQIASVNAAVLVSSDRVDMALDTCKRAAADATQLSERMKQMRVDVGNSSSDSKWAAEAIGILEEAIGKLQGDLDGVKQQIKHGPGQGSSKGSTIATSGATLCSDPSFRPLWQEIELLQHQVSQLASTGGGGGQDPHAAAVMARTQQHITSLVRLSEALTARQDQMAQEMFTLRSSSAAAAAAAAAASHQQHPLFSRGGGGGEEDPRLKREVEHLSMAMEEVAGRFVSMEQDIAKAFAGCVRVVEIKELENHLMSRHGQLQQEVEAITVAVRHMDRDMTDAATKVKAAGMVRSAAWSEQGSGGGGGGGGRPMVMMQAVPMQMQHMQMQAVPMQQLQHPPARKVSLAFQAAAGASGALVSNASLGAGRFSRMAALGEPGSPIQVEQQPDCNRSGVASPSLSVASPCLSGRSSPAGSFSGASAVRPVPPNATAKVSLSYQAGVAARQSEAGSIPMPIVLNPAAAPPSHRVLRKASTTGDHTVGGGSITGSPTGSQCQYNHLMLPGISRAISGQPGGQADAITGQIENIFSQLAPARK